MIDPDEREDPRDATVYVLVVLLGVAWCVRYPGPVSTTVGLLLLAGLWGLAFAAWRRKP